MEDASTVRIDLGEGKCAWIDVSDLDLCAPYRWRPVLGNRVFYAVASIAKRMPVPMHRLIMKPRAGMVVDHINGDGLDNRRSNLRVCTTAQNVRNQNVREDDNKTSQFKGVYRDHDVGRWRAHIQHDGDGICLGSFSCEERAARQYDRAARLFFGQYARTNEMMGLY